MFWVVRRVTIEFIHTACEDASKVGQLQSGNFTRLRLTITPLLENYIGLLGQSNHHQKIDTLSTCAKGSMGLKDQYAMFNSCREPRSNTD